jgi:hypothetical protein
MSNKSRIASLDPGTMFLQTAELQEDGSVSLKSIRNAFVEVQATEDIEDILKQNSWHYVKDGDQYFVIGEDALKVARMFPNKVTLRRPMQDGVLNKGEEKKMLIMAELIDSALGKAPDKNSVVCTCVSSESADESADSQFHSARLEGMLERNGWNVKVIEEGLGIILSERPVVIDEDGKEYPYSGIGISFGAGRTNCVLAYKGLSVVGASVARSGDWIDKQVSTQTGTDIAQVTAKKERELDFDNLNSDDDVIFALDVYYTAMIKYVIGIIAKKFMKVRSEFDAPLDIVVAGGTSMPKGFCNKLKKVISDLTLPFEIKDVKRASEPRNAVVKGCLTQAIATQKKLVKNKGKAAPKVEKEEVEEEI